MPQRLYRIERDNRTWIGTQSRNRPTTDGMNAVRQFLDKAEGARLVDEVELDDGVLFVTLDLDAVADGNARNRSWHDKLADNGVQATSGDAEEYARAQIEHAHELIRAAYSTFEDQQHHLLITKQKILALVGRR